MPSSASMHPKLLKADFHGSIMTGLYSCYYFILAYIIDFSSPEQESLSLRSLGNCDPWNWECVQSCDKARQIERYTHPDRQGFIYGWAKNYSLVIPKRSSIFAFAVPLYSTLPPTHTTDMPLPLAPPFPAGSCTPAEAEAVASLRKTVLDNPHIEFELHGNQFRFRSSDRAGRKFKHKETIELWSGSLWCTIEYTPCQSLRRTSVELYKQVSLSSTFPDPIPVFLHSSFLSHTHLLFCAWPFSFSFSD